jgi:hypothetical protein
LRLEGAILSAEGRRTPRLEALGLAEGSFLLCVSALRARKHALWLYAVCAALRRERRRTPPLVFAGRAADLRILEILMRDPLWGDVGIFVEDPDDSDFPGSIATRSAACSRLSSPARA